ncbi:hypothetical protein RV02_GL000965 [Enterococcus gilvus]|nr:hypothetical protein RV02_GL000965 [Enterococcus gilvus]
MFFEIIKIKIISHRIFILLTKKDARIKLKRRLWQKNLLPSK